MKTTCAFLILIILSSAALTHAQIVPGTIVEEEIPLFLSTPAEGYSKEVPIIIIRYLPTIEGINIDVAQATDYFSLGNITQ